MKVKICCGSLVVVGFFVTSVMAQPNPAKPRIYMDAEPGATPAAEFNDTNEDLIVVEQGNTFDIDFYYDCSTDGCTTAAALGGLAQLTITAKGGAAGTLTCASASNAGQTVLPCIQNDPTGCGPPPTVGEASFGGCNGNIVSTTEYIGKISLTCSAASNGIWDVSYVQNDAAVSFIWNGGTANVAPVADAANWIGGYPGNMDQILRVNCIPPPKGACCDQSTIPPTCDDTTYDQEQCETLGRVFKGDNTTCPVDVCALCVCGLPVCLDVEDMPLKSPDCIDDVNSNFTVSVELGMAPDLVAAQFRVVYDPGVVFVSSGPGVDCDASSEFVTVLDQDSGPGWVWIAVKTELLMCTSDADCPGGAGGAGCDTVAGYCRKTADTSSGNVAAACLTFKLAKGADACDGGGWCFEDLNPMINRVVNSAGETQILNDDGCDHADGCEYVIPNSDISITVPPGVNENSDCEKQTTNISWACPTAADECGVLSAIGCTVTQQTGSPHIDPNWVADCGGLFPQGSWLFDCTVSDTECGDSDTDSWVVAVSSETAMQTQVQLSPTIDPAAAGMTRVIDFYVYEACSPVIVRTLAQRDVTFGDGVSTGWIGHFQGEIKIPKGQYSCISAQDKLHTLRACSDIVCDGGDFHSAFKGDPDSVMGAGNWLIGGNLDSTLSEPDGSPRCIDIVDYGIFVSQFLNNVGINTTLATKATDFPHSDINGDGFVDDMDFSFIANNFLTCDKNCCCPGDRDVPVGRTSISVRELNRLGLGDLSASDMNGDGMVDMGDMALFLGGAEPKTPGHSNR